ncbi:NADH-quinone oxidoreductase subunit D [Desulfobotulus mexicanus]|uniref:NADH-quinone oxidoreductase subunit D n=1 Tax=Desulfobotulus mexicanus TaxID=2586642 RepID=A0A5Q4VFT9_9BACT|nr:NADH-quinone oxidoreductase subunit D [Desulfobotulus mexicanus]TYT74881.1 NADH-quinone oxidoreductase subunit D [Desulfobotulus mexicanus]
MKTEAFKDESRHRFLLNMGPQHPATHGVLRLVLEMDGEYVVHLDPVLGYGHRMHEKMAEARPWPSFMPNTARMDYLAALPYNHGYVCLIEKLAGVEVPRRAECIRVATSELNRIASHLLWLGAFLLDLGAFTPILYGFDDREEILDILEDITGSRLTYSYFRVGGVYRDVDEKFVEKSRAFVKRMTKRLDIYHKLVTDNIIFRKRTEGIGVISPEMARRYGVTGANLRGSGIAYDIRRTEPYSIYPELDFEIPVGSSGDCFDRYAVRLKEIEQSLRIIEQALDMLPEGEFRGKVPKKIKLPPKAASFAVEAARGELVYYMVGQDSDVPYRLKVRVPSYANLSLIAELCQGMLIADLVSVMGSLDLVIPEIDR